jgi:outer membrane protein assembly factor BamB
VADPDGVYVFFESGDLIGLSHNGEVKWQRSLSREYGELKNHHGLGSSLAQTDKAVIVLVDHGGPSYLLAVEKATGKNLWKTERKGCQSWTSPVVTTHEGHSVVLASGGGSLTCYDIATGKELWSLDGLSGNDIPSPAVADGLVFVVAGENPLKPNSNTPTRSNCCLRLTLNESKPGQETLWRSEKPLAYHASPVIHRGHVYIVTKNSVLHCLDAKTGAKQYAERLDNPCWATPIAAGDHVYFFGTDGVTTVIKAGLKFVKVASNRLWTDDDFQASKEAARKQPENQVPPLPRPPEGKKVESPPITKEQMEEMFYEAVGDVVYGVAAVDGTLYLRTGTGLYCIREAK